MQIAYSCDKSRAVSIYCVNLVSVFRDSADYCVSRRQSMNFCGLAFGLGHSVAAIHSGKNGFRAVEKVHKRLSPGTRRSHYANFRHRHFVALLDTAAGSVSTRIESASVEISDGKLVTFETGRVSRQAAGSVIVRQGNTMVFCTACAESLSSNDVDFMPLRVDYAEKFSSRGRTVGSYMKREGRPSEREIIASRLIDRPLRPMFTKGYVDEVQVLASVFSYDGIHPGDALAICGCSAALHISKIPLSKAVAGVRIARINGAFIVNPTVSEAEMSTTDLVIAGTKDAILMIEGVCDFLSEDQILEAVEMAHKAIVKLCGAMDELRAKAGTEKISVVQEEISTDIVKRIQSFTPVLDIAIAVAGKKAREEGLRSVEKQVFDELLPSVEARARNPEGSSNAERAVRRAYKQFLSERVRHTILERGVRPDGRDLKTVRPISIEQGFLPCAHGSSLFTRGETQALAVATLGGEEMAQKFETLEGEDVARFYLQYTFPPSSVGEVGRLGAPSRREVGHGKLAERALSVVLPSRKDFPYVTRVESSITESCGSSSMASVCGGCLALMDAGVPITSPVAGVAMGLVLDRETNRAAVLTDILGLEDAFGDMDFKVAGTAEAVTALQMDIKVEGITMEIMRQALEQAKEGRLHILAEMQKAQSEPNPNLPSSLPKVETMSIPVKRIGDAIGAGGRNIRSVIEQCGGDANISISIQDDGVVLLSSPDGPAIVKAKELIEGMLATIDVGDRFDGVVTKVLPFGAYVEFGNGKEAWMHISELEYKRTAAVEDVCKVGDKVRVQVIELGRNGQVRVSRKACLSEEQQKSRTQNAGAARTTSGTNATA